MTEWPKEAITELRKSLGLTQRLFSEAIGVTAVYVNYLEKGVRRPSKTLCIMFDCMKKKAARKKTETEKEVKDHG